MRHDTAARGRRSTAVNALQLSVLLFVLALLLCAAWFWLPGAWLVREPHVRPQRMRVSQRPGQIAILLVSGMLLAGFAIVPNTWRGVLAGVCAGWLLGLSMLLWWRAPRTPTHDPTATDDRADELQAMLDAIPLAVAQVDRRRCLTRVNPLLLDLLEIPADALPPGTPVVRLVQLLARHCAVDVESEPEAGAAPRVASDLLEPLLSHGQVDADGFLRIPGPHGLWLGLKLQAAQGGGWLVLVSDLTERQRMEQGMREIDLATRKEVDRRTRELRQARQDAEQANVSRTRFLTAASHDLLQPMNAARLLAGSLADTVSADAETTAIAKRIEEAIVAAESILDSLLEAGRLDAQAVKPRIGVVSVARLFDALNAQFAPVAARRKLKLRLRPSTLQIRSDQVLLQRLLSNLLSNALRYTSRGGVLVGARKRGDSVLIQVIDTGMGIDAAQQQSIFHEFRTGGQESPWGERGLGLGLALCNRTAALLQHPFGVNSVTARGSCFHLSVPLAGELGQQQPGLVEAPAKAALDHLRVLCIDDDAVSLGALGELLRRWGVQVREAGNYRRACELMIEFEPQVLLVDYLLDTELDGFDVIAELRRLSRPDLPAAVVSATRSDFLRDQAESLHCELFLKPVKPALLKAWLSLLGAQ